MVDTLPYESDIGANDWAARAAASNFGGGGALCVDLWFKEKLGRMKMPRKSDATALNARLSDKITAIVKTSGDWSTLSITTHR